MNPMKLANKVVVITGAATGIGKAIAVAMAREGAAVVIDYIGEPDTPTDALAHVESVGGKAIAVHADISDPDQVGNLISETITTFGRLDILVNNAGYQKFMPFLETPLDVWRKVIATDLTGAWLCCQAAAKQMAAQGDGGRIINISSVHEDLPAVRNAPYCAAKGGLRMLMRTLAVELAPHGITVNNIGPGAIATPMTGHLENDPERKANLLERIPARRVGEPEEVAELAVYLASDAAAYVTGSTYFIDGGLLGHRNIKWHQ
jgi:glucose 1-dehydrogenase